MTSDGEVLTLEELSLEDGPDDFEALLDAEVVEDPAMLLDVPAPKQKKSKKAKAEDVALFDIGLGSSPRGAGLEAEFSEAGGTKKHARILGYGKNKTGKTTLASSYGKGTLIIKFEDGTLSARGSGAMQYPRNGKIELWEQVEELYWYLKTKCDEGKPPFEVLVFDTLTRMRQLTLRHTVLGSAAFDPTRDTIAPTQKDYGNAGQKMIYWLSAFADLPMHIVWLCQEKSGGEDSDMGQLEGYPDLPTQVRNYVLGDADVIGRTFKKSVEKDGKNFVSFRIKFGPDEAFVTGDRTNALPKVMANPKLREIVSKMFGEGGEAATA